MTYRDDKQALRANVSALEEQLAEVEAAKTALAEELETQLTRREKRDDTLRERLERAETALDAYRKSAGPPAVARPWAATVLALAGSLYGFAIVLAMTDYDSFAEAFAGAALAVAIFTTPVAWWHADKRIAAFVAPGFKLFLCGLLWDALGGKALTPLTIFQNWQHFWYLPSLVLVIVAVEYAMLRWPVDERSGRRD